MNHEGAERYEPRMNTNGHEWAEGVFNHEKHEKHERHEMTEGIRTTNGHQWTRMSHEWGEGVFNHENHEKHERDTEVGVSVEQNA